MSQRQKEAKWKDWDLRTKSHLQGTVFVCSSRKKFHSKRIKISKMDKKFWRKSGLRSFFAKKLEFVKNFGLKRRFERILIWQLFRETKKFGRRLCLKFESKFLGLLYHEMRWEHSYDFWRIIRKFFTNVDNQKCT